MYLQSQARDHQCQKKKKKVIQKVLWDVMKGSNHARMAIIEQELALK